MQTRRAFTREALGSLLTFSLLETLWQRDLFGDEIKPLAARWVADVNQLGWDLKGQKLAQVEWQAKVERGRLCLRRRLDRPDL